MGDIQNQFEVRELTLDEVEAKAKDCDELFIRALLTTINGGGRYVSKFLSAFASSLNSRDIEDALELLNTSDYLMTEVAAKMIELDLDRKNVNPFELDHSEEEDDNV